MIDKKDKLQKFKLLRISVDIPPPSVFRAAYEQLHTQRHSGKIAICHAACAEWTAGVIQRFSLFFCNLKGIVRASN